MSGVVIKGVSRTFPGVNGGAPIQALAPVDLTVADGEFVAILGPSGCGKSTLLRAVAGLDTPTTGTITLDGQAVSEPGRDRGMVFQSYTLFPWLTIVENIEFGPRESGMAPAARRAIAEKLMAQVGLTQFANHYPKQLSGGMQQRAALARALANDPKVLLLDEPFGALDHQTRSLMQELLLSIWEQHRKTILFVTHDIEEAVFMANRVLVMSARPGRFKSEVTVPFAHPRSYKIKTTPEFAALEEKLTEDIRGETMMAVSSGL
ncbi:ABC transporter ATP-binding protein [Phreatobacter aquaticus]|uniref:ABC transporter ATP-binding protein n=1 Tax=Phreatobacter aquaticus TaxID=2570229 RepID=A0A4D7Q828_9HYPH|nr:ABC transporter ATP-binding protein [Phreatobacter aquaticus]QCK84350.1 ABC transporter ATP-binding protein [Phreatobacter aquaticus]